ncbi:unnamed protein product [Ectocarpus sp. CCAP 1310/34]|nr:unnamed protein product [Ectocarpus sp. CCAP 1310/34]
MPQNSLLSRRSSELHRAPRGSQVGGELPTVVD